MSVELERLSCLAAVIEAAERELALAHRTVRQTAAARLRCGEAALAEVSAASGLEEGELLDLPELAAPPRQHRNRPRKRSSPLRLQASGSPPPSWHPKHRQQMTASKLLVPLPTIHAYRR